MSLRRVRSPDAPNTTIAHGCARRSTVGGGSVSRVRRSGSSFGLTAFPVSREHSLPRLGDRPVRVLRHPLHAHLGATTVAAPHRAEGLRHTIDTGGIVPNPIPEDKHGTEEPRA